jgi:hypothetical protein
VLLAGVQAPGADGQVADRGSSDSRASGREDGAREPPKRDTPLTGRALVTGATGFVGGRLASAPAGAGWDVRCMVRDRPGARGGGDRARASRRRRAARRDAGGRGRRRRRRLSPDPLDGTGRRRRLRRERERSRRGVGANGAGRGRRQGGVPRQAPRSPGVEAPAQPPRDRRRARRAWAAVDLLPRRDGGRSDERVVPDAAQPGAAVAGR